MFAQHTIDVRSTSTKLDTGMTGKLRQESFRDMLPSGLTRQDTPQGTLSWLTALKVVNIHTMGGGKQNGKKNINHESNLNVGVPIKK